MKQAPLPRMRHSGIDWVGEVPCYVFRGNRQKHLYAVKPERETRRAAFPYPDIIATFVGKV